MKSNISIIPLISMLLLTAYTPSLKADEYNSWYFSPNVSYINPDSDREAADDFGLMLGLAKELSYNWNIEISAVMNNLSLHEHAYDYKQRGLMLDGHYFFSRKTIMQTYALAGIGLMSTDVKNEDDTNPMFNVGVGITQQVSDTGIRFRADIRYRLDLDSQSISTKNKYNDFILNVGVSMPFGHASSYQKNNGNNTSRFIDSDNDSIADSNDRCPGSAAGVNVDDRGCLDVIEKRAYRNKRTGVNGTFIDYGKTCQSISTMLNTSDRECIVSRSNNFQDLKFFTGSNRLATKSKIILNTVAETLNDNIGLKIELTGYTDNSGNTESNKHLSLDRAKSVELYLISEGVNAHNIIARGYGADNPIANNNSEYGRGVNRRVELQIFR